MDRNVTERRWQGDVGCCRSLRDRGRVQNLVRPPVSPNGGRAGGEQARHTGDVRREHGSDEDRVADQVLRGNREKRSIGGVVEEEPEGLGR